MFQADLGGPDDLRDLDRYQIVTVNAIKDRFREIRVPVKAGYRKVGATFVARSHAESDYALQRFVPGEGLPDVPWMLGFEVVGPYEPTGISEQTRSRERIFSCYPKDSAEELPCAEQILSRLARLAFRRPTTETEIERLLGVLSRRSRPTVDSRAASRRACSRSCRARTSCTAREPGGAPAGVEPGAVYAISDLELASRLAFFLWSEGPDDELLTLADAKRLSDPKIYAEQVARMLADPRSRSLVTNFAFQWLSVRGLDVIDPDPKLYPNFDEDLRKAFVGEMDRFLDSILRDDKHSVLELLDAKYTFVNERLARHYGISGIRGDRFRRVELDDPRRFGLFGKGSVLLATSYPDRTSPVLRGAWIMEHVLGTAPPPPPPGVSTNLAPLAIEQPHSVRERLQLHRTLSSCNGCHGVIDPLGQALENYNAVGEWRTFERDSGAAIDPTGKLANGKPVSSPIDLREALRAEPDQFVQTVVQNLMTYALGRRVEYYDMPALRAIVRDSAHDHYSFAAIVKGVANSVPFRMRTAPEIVKGPTETVAAATGANSGGEN